MRHGNGKGRYFNRACRAFTDAALVCGEDCQYEKSSRVVDLPSYFTRAPRALSKRTRSKARRPGTRGPASITLEQAIQFALQHNHSLLAARSTILQNQASEITANLRPNPTLSWDSQFLPLFNLSQFNATYLNNNAQFDLGVGYTFERGKKRQHRLQAAQDQTAVTRSQVADNERHAHLQRRATVRGRAAGAVHARSGAAEPRQLPADG